MREVSVSVQGLSATLHAGVIDTELMATYEFKERIYGGRRNGRFRDVVSEEPIFIRNGKYIRCGIGAILFLARNNPFLSFNFTEILPERKPLPKMEIPQKVLDSPKWKVNGKERWYFHEALEACSKNHSGTIKLPTGSGKTVIELTLAYNQLREIGSGLIIVPTNTIKDQFLKSASQFGIELRDYREWLCDFESDKKSIIISLPIVLYNDITSSTLDPKIKEKLLSIQWIIGDEVHHAGCETWNGIFMGLPNLSRGYGMSALPVTESLQQSVNFSSVSLEDALTISTVGPVIYEKSTKELKDFLNIPSLINFKYTWPKDRWPDQQTDDWHKLRQLQHKNTERLEVIANVIRILIERKYRTIIHVGEKKLGTELLKLVNSDKCATWYGGGEVEVSEELYRKIMEAEGVDLRGSMPKISTDLLRKYLGTLIFGTIGTSHLIEGLDLDSPLNALVLVEGKKARQILQKCGRIVRPDVKPSIIVNIMDEGLWILPKHSKERKDWIQSEFDTDTYNAQSLSHLETILAMIEKR